MWIVGQRWIFLLIQGHLVPGLFFSFLCSYIQKCFFWVRAEILLLCAEKLPFLGFMQKYSKKYSPLLLGPGKLGSRGPIQLSRPNLPRTCGNRMGSWQIVPRTVGPVVRHKKVDSWAQLSGDAFASKTNSRKERKEVNKNQNRVPIQSSQNLTYWWFLAGDIYIQTGHYSIHNDKCLALSKRDESGNLTIMLLAPRSGALSRLAFRGPSNPNPSQSTYSF